MSRRLEINWNDIRAVEGQREGFEELVCQLAGQETITGQVQFTRIGKPDGGKECFWELDNGDLHFWQAKYFVNSLSDSQWQQLKKSIKTAINNHPRLKKYYVSIPIDRPDGKGRGKSMLQKWNDWVTKWENYASSKNMNVSFEYWGRHELEVRLRKPKNRGLIFYFFNRYEITSEWLNKKNQESIDALGPRYTPELNFELPLLKFHDGFTRGQKFVEQLNSYYGPVLEKQKSIDLSSHQKTLSSKSAELHSTIDVLRKIYENSLFSGTTFIPFNDIKSQLNKVFGIANSIVDLLSKNYNKIGEEKQLSNDNLPALRELSSAVEKFNRFLNSNVCQIANRPYLLLLGPAGIGKSHTLADIVIRRQQDGLDSLLLLGENFSTNELPWTQILRNQLRFDGDEITLLGALNAKAESQQSRLLIIIDALNEGNGRKVWPKRLKSFVRSFEPFPWLGLIVSIRDSFEQLIVPTDTIDVSVATRIHHPGFRELEYDASTHFFQHYDIIPPGSPLLHPEFQNPLFLRLFCEGLYKRGLQEIPEGYEGISVIIDSYLMGVEQKLSRPDELDYDCQLKLLRKSIENLLLKMVEEKKDHLAYDTAEEIVRMIFSGKCGSEDKQYLKRLISEAVISENLYWDEQETYNGIHFAYQRFQDHLMVAVLLDKYLDSENPVQSFASGRLKDIVSSFYQQNLIEALSIQVPERIGKELHEVTPYAAESYPIVAAFIHGLTWRRFNTIGNTALDYVNDVIIQQQDYFESFLEQCISMAMKPAFYFNADKLHEFLFRQPLANRDSWWTTWLHYQYETTTYTSVKRLIDWAWDDIPKHKISDESIRLAAFMLAWFLTSSNRYLRDAATKSLINILQDRIDVLIKVLQKFEGVNDPYVYERLYAVAYGCALRSYNQPQLAALCNYIYQTIFYTEQVYPHILLRDYARGVIEYALYLNLAISIDIRKVRPPYKSTFPNKLPTIAEIDTKYTPNKEEGNYGGEKWGTTAILNSMTTEYGRGTARYGDFGRYVFQRALKNWAVDYNGLSNYAVQRIFELGYDPAIFTSFDKQQGSGRHARGSSERIGKKYQWIIFYEILAQVADNCKLYAEETYEYSQDKNYASYDGPWHPYVRDIDPTMLIKSTKKVSGYEIATQSSWWVSYYDQNWEEDAKLWKERCDDLPEVSELLSVTDSKGVEWLNLNIFSRWKEPKKIGEEHLSINGKSIRYDIGSWLIKQGELDKLLRTKSSIDNYRNWIPQPSNRYQVFSREYSWSPASLFFQSDQYHGGDALSTQLVDSKNKEVLAIAKPTVVHFLWEEEFDMSKEEAISYYKPSSLLSRDLVPSLEEGKYLNAQGEIVCFDPSIYETGFSCLLIRKDYLEQKLAELDLVLVWVVEGEKRIFGSEQQEGIDFDHAVGGIYHLNSSGLIQGELKSFITRYNDQINYLRDMLEYRQPYLPEFIQSIYDQYLEDKGIQNTQDSFNDFTNFMLGSQEEE